MIKLSVFAFLCYLLGSVPSAYIIGKIKKGIDIRTKGTGNVGATNTLLVVGPSSAALVYSIDVLKGFLAVWIAKIFIGTDISIGLCGLTAILGHNYSIFLNFTGGKGVATTTGVLFAIHTKAMLMLLAVWIVSVCVFNSFILSSLISLMLIPFMLFFYRMSGILIVFGFIYFLAGLYSHRKDIAKIYAGEGNKAFESISKYFKK
jgi:acyl phosphate:glycerol-3-phosphate acyltransferase